MFRVKRYVVSGQSKLTAGLTVESVEPYTGQTYSPSRSATAGIPWTHWALARNPRAARRASIKAHDAYVATEYALCGPGCFDSSLAMSRTDAGFNA